jgi:voltage-gated potassium channel
MMSFFKKLFVGKEGKQFRLPNDAYKNQILNIKRIWNNELYNDFGIERIFRLLICSAQIIFPGMLVRSISGRFGLLSRKMAVESYVILKVIIPVIFLVLSVSTNTLVFAISICLIFETLFYLANLIFLSDLNARPISYKRTIILIFLNYIEITLNFAVLYSHSNYLNHAFKNNLEAVYFSFVTTATIGYGDFSPNTSFGQLLVICQSIFFFIFLGIFLNFFASRIEDESYYNNEKINKWKNLRQ